MGKLSAMHRFLRRSPVPVLAAMVLVVAGGCGSRLSQTQIAADAKGQGGGSATVSAGQPDSSSSSGIVGGAGGSPGGSGAGIGSGGGAGGASGARVGGSSGGGGSSGVGAASGGGAGTASGGGGASSGGATAAGGSSGQSGSLAPIVIGNVSTLSGPAGSAQAPGVAALQVWVRWINSQGGIKGHPVRLYVEDDASDPAQHASEVEDLVNNKHVIALVDDWASQTDQGGEQFIDQHQIPVIGGDSSIPLWYQDPMFFPDGTDSTANNLADDELWTARHLAPQAGNNLGVLVCVESSICSNYAAGMQSRASANSYKIVYNGSGSLAQPDYTANCLSAHSANAGILAIEFDQASIKRIGRSCSSQGYHPVYAMNAAVDTTFDGDPTWNGSVLESPIFPFQGATSSAFDQFQSALQKFDPNAVLSGPFIGGWVSGMELLQAAQKIGATPTSQQLLAGLWSFRNQTLGGLVGPLTFNKGQPATPMNCFFPMAFQNGKFVAPQGGNHVCL